VIELSPSDSLPVLVGALLALYLAIVFALGQERPPSAAYTLILGLASGCFASILAILGALIPVVLELGDRSLARWGGDAEWLDILPYFSLATVIVCGLTGLAAGSTVLLLRRTIREA
jgi:hypothetical protein